SGVHAITATVTDAGGRSATAQVTVTVNSAPTLAITAPAANGLFDHGSVVLTATASDVEDGNLGASVRWTSSHDGALGTGALLAVTTLSSGAHTITATVTDAGGRSAAATVAIVVDSRPTIAIS